MKQRILLIILLFCTTICRAGDSIHVSSQRLSEAAGFAIGSSTALVAIDIEAVRLSSALNIYLSGTNRKEFGLRLESETGTGKESLTLPAGEGVTRVYLIYTPTSAGVHKANIYIESNVSMELNQIFSVQAVGYDPLNPPTITINNSSLQAFHVETAGESEQQQFTITTANLLDWNGSIRFTSQSEAGTFTISNTSLVKSGTTQYTLTFRPKKEGSFSATLEASALLTDTLRLTISGTCGSGSQPEEKREGDEPVLDDSHPLARYETGFEGVTRNGVLQLAGWTNIAEVGTRAWWGYDFEGNSCAKVTPYDSQTATPSACRMLLVSPALNYSAAEHKMLRFRLRGDFLYDGLTDTLEVCYIDVLEGDSYIEPIRMHTPSTADESGNWYDYEVDLTGQNVADTFFIGFRLSATRGESVATYYVDDFSWGISKETTATPLTKSDVVARKVLKNGVLEIIHGDMRFNILGVRIF